MACHQPTPSVHFARRRKANGGDPLNRCPMEYSKNSNGIPADNSATRYGMIKAPPPFSYAMYGKRQIFPRPTAEPIAARINTQRPPKPERPRALAGIDAVYEDMITPLRK